MAKMFHGRKGLWRGVRGGGFIKAEGQAAESAGMSSSQWTFELADAQRDGTRRIGPDASTPTVRPHSGSDCVCRYCVGIPDAPLIAARRLLERLSPRLPPARLNGLLHLAHANFRS